MPPFLSSPGDMPPDGLGNGFPIGNYRFTTFAKVKAIKFPRGLTSSDDEAEKKRKPAGWYPGMTDDEDEEEETPPAKNKKMVKKSVTSSRIAQPSNRASRGTGVRGVSWTVEEDTFVLETWVAWPECQYDELTELINDKFNNNRTSGGMRQRYASKKKWMLTILDAATDKNAPSMGWKQT